MSKKFYRPEEAEIEDEEEEDYDNEDEDDEFEDRYIQELQEQQQQQRQRLRVLSNHVRDASQAVQFHSEALSATDEIIQQQRQQILDLDRQNTKLRQEVTRLMQIISEMRRRSITPTQPVASRASTSAVTPPFSTRTSMSVQRTRSESPQVLSLATASQLRPPRVEDSDTPPSPSVSTPPPQEELDPLIVPPKPKAKRVRKVQVSEAPPPSQTAFEDMVRRESESRPFAPSSLENASPSPIKTPKNKK